MRWATRVMIHLDRVASAWLIVRFVDPDAQFMFLADGEAAPDDVMLFGIPGAPLGPHDAGVTTFRRILDAYSINDSGLTLLEWIIADIVDHVMHDDDRADLASRDPYIGGVLALAEGVMLLSATDGECLERSIPFYDALYARLEAQIVLNRVAPSPPASVLEQTLQLSKATNALRKAGSPFVSDALEVALRTGFPP